MKEKQSKRRLILIGIVSLILVVAMVASTVACAKPAPAPAPAPAPTPAPAPAPAPAKPITLVCNLQETADSDRCINFYSPWFAELEKRTGGRVKIETHYGGELASVMDAYEAVTRGTVDIAEVFTMMITGKFPMDEIMTFWSFDTECQRYGRVYWELYQKFPEMQVPYKDVKLLWLGQTRAAGFGTTKKPIRTLEDNRGLKMLAHGRWSGFRGEALGWTLVTIPPPDLFPSLEKGVMDGTPISLFSLWWMKLGEVLHYITLVPWPGVNFAMVMNLNTWNKLPADVQKIMDEMIDWTVDLHDEEQVRDERKCIAKAPQEFDIQFIELSPEEVARWVEVDRPVFEQYAAELEAKGLPGKKLMEEFLQMAKKYSAEEYAFK